MACVAMLLALLSCVGWAQSDARTNHAVTADVPADLAMIDAGRYTDSRSRIHQDQAT
jgi:hypothetical protein